MASIHDDSLTFGSSSDGNALDSSASLLRQSRENSGRLSNSLTRHAPSTKGSLRRSMVQDVHINTLRYHAMGIHGRDSEQEQLQTSLENLACQHQLVLISGESGTGKTTLAESVQQIMQKRYPDDKETKSIMLCGKFDRTYNLPYAAFAQALRGFVAHVLSLDDRDTVHAIQSSLQENIGRQERVALLQSFPVLEELFVVAEECYYSSSASNSDDEPNQEKSRLHHAFRGLVSSIEEYLDPFALLLDDLQWVDSASLELLEFLLTDATQTQRILVVGCYRTEQLSETHILTKALSDLRKRQESNGAFEITDISLGNLDVRATSCVLADLLSMDHDDSKLVELAEVCHLKTQGNAFFLVSFVTRLYQEKSLEYQLGSFQWKWDITEIRSYEVTENVAEFVMNRMATLPADAVLAVQLAACLGHRFPYTVLKVLFETFNEGAYEKALDYERGIGILREEFILHDVAGVFARFAHDKVKEAASNLIPPDEVQSFKKRMGDVLLANFNLGEMDTSVFIVADLCNEGPTPATLEERLLIANVNLEAAKTAAKMTAIDVSWRYAEKGIELLPEDKWTSQEDLSCSLYQIACRAECCLGQYSELEALSSEILDRKEIALEKRLPVYYANIHMLESKNDGLQAAIDLSLDVLLQMGHKFPNSKFMQIIHVIGVLNKIKSLVRRLTPKMVDALPMMNDPELCVTMRALDKLGAVCFLAGSPLFPLIMYRSLDLTLKHGISESAPAVFASIGLLLGAALQDYIGAGCFANHALRLMRRIPNPENVYSRVTFLTHFFSLSWSEPVNSMVKPILKAYAAGLKTGDVDSAVYAIGTYVIIALLAGRSLEGLAEDCQIYLGQMKELGRDRMYVSSNLFWQLILNLRGECEDHLTLTGVAMNETEFLTLIEDPKNENHLFIFYHVRAMLYAVFGEHELGAKHALANSKRFFKLFQGYPGVPCTTYYFGVALFSEARKGKPRKHVARGRFMIKRTKSYIKKGNPNAAHYLLGLEAELLAWKGRLNEAMQKFEASIAVAVRSGFVHDAAIMNERYGEFLFEQNEHKEKAVFFLDKAFQLYMEWGAKKKADLLQSKYREVWSNSGEIVAVQSNGSSDFCGSSLFSLQ